MLVSEIFGGLQGEGVSLGIPSIFIRLTGCNLACKWCDTLEVWKHGEQRLPEEIAAAVLHQGVSEDLLRRGLAHIVLTGGEPLLSSYANNVRALVEELHHLFGSELYLEVETNGTQESDILHLFDQINCSPKLSNSGEPDEKRFNTKALAKIAHQPFSYFKFVISSPEDWNEIEKDFVPLIGRSRILLMPAGIDREELIKNSPMVWDIAMRNGVRATTRLQTITYDNMHGK